MRHWSRNDKFAFFGVLLAVVSVATGVFGTEIRRGLGLDAAQNQASIAAPAYAARQLPLPAKSAPSDSSVSIKITGDANMISIEPSDIASETNAYNVVSDRGTNEFHLGPKQTASIQITGDSNTVHVPAKLEDRVTVVDNGDRNITVH